MVNLTKIILGAIAWLAVTILAGIVGYAIRDSFDAPRLQIERVQYKITRQQCRPLEELFYRFKTAYQLRDFIEKNVPWSLVSDIQDGCLEYDHVEDLLSKLPIRLERLNNEVPFLNQLVVKVQDFLSADTPQTRNGVKDAIAFLCGSDEKATLAHLLAKGEDPLTAEYVKFELDPIGFAHQLKSSLEARRNALTQETSIIESLIVELRKCYEAGRPVAIPMVGNDLSKIPNVEFEITLSNQGRTDGQVSYSVTYQASGSDHYRIALVGQNPKIHYPLSPYLWATVDANQLSELVYGIDRVRNDLDVVKKFYTALTSEHGLTGSFLVTDIRGRSYEFKVESLLPYN